MVNSRISLLCIDPRILGTANRGTRDRLGHRAVGSAGDGDRRRSSEVSGIPRHRARSGLGHHERAARAARPGDIASDGPVAGWRPTHAERASAVKVAAIASSHPERISREASRGTISRKIGKILSPRMDGRSVEKMASDGGIAFKELQSWTILLVGRPREKNQGTGGLAIRDARKQSQAGARADRGPGKIGPGRCIGRVGDGCCWHHVATQPFGALL